MLNIIGNTSENLLKILGKICRKYFENFPERHPETLRKILLKILRKNSRKSSEKSPEIFRKILLNIFGKYSWKSPENSLKICGKFFEESGKFSGKSPERSRQILEENLQKIIRKTWAKSPKISSKSGKSPKILRRIFYNPPRNIRESHRKISE